MQWLRLAAAIAAAVFLSCGSAFAADLAQLKRDYAAAKAVVDDQKFPGFSIPDTPRASAALDKEWYTVEAWIAASLDGQNSVDPERLLTIVKRLDRNYSANVVVLASDTFLIGIARNEIGTFFVLRKTNLHFELAWRVTQATSSKTHHTMLTDAWKVEGAKKNCRNQMPSGLRCGPLFPVSLGTIPKDLFGHARFYVDAEYAQAMGATAGMQFSIWSWDGHGARPIFDKSYDQELDAYRVPVFRDDTLHIRTKQEFRNFFSCGACVGRQTIWSLRITPDGVQDLGTKSLMPEIDAIDDLVGSVAHGKPTTDLAAPAVVKMLAPLVVAQKDESRKIDPNWFSLGMIGNGEAETNPSNKAESLVCFSTDADGERYLFTLDRKLTGFFVARVRDLGQRDTPDGLCSKPNL